MLNAMDLFSGIGGNSIALAEYCKTIVYCEADRHAQSVLISRMSDGQLGHAPICTDVTKLDGNAWRGRIDIIIAGFPCQDISVAGNGAGLSGERSGLFFEVVRLAKEIKPTFLFLENVPAIRTRGLDTVIQELTEIGYDCRWTMLSAAAVGAPHKRERWFLLAHATGSGSERELRELQSKNASQRQSEEQQDPCRQPNDASQQPDAMAHANQRNDSAECSRQRWSVEPNVDRVVNGFPQRVDRIKRLGNAVVPEQARQAFKILIGIHPPTGVTA